MSNGWRQGFVRDDTGALVVSGGVGSGSPTIQDEGAALAKRDTINFVGAGVTATDDAANSRTLVTIPGGGSGSQAIPVVVKTAGYTPVSGDEFKRFEFATASGTPAFTIPADATTNFGVGTWFEVVSDNLNLAVITPAGGVSVSGGPLKVGLNHVVRVLKRDANYWIVDASLPGNRADGNPMVAGDVPAPQADGSVAWQAQAQPGLAPNGAIAESFPAYVMGPASAGVRQASGQQRLARFDQPVKAGQTITTINVLSASSSGAGQTHLWFTLYRASDRALLGVTVDALTGLWSANTVYSLNLQTPYVAAQDFIPVVGVVMVATTVATVMMPAAGNATMDGFTALGITGSGQGATGLTVPSDAPATYTVPATPQMPFYAYLT